MRRFLQAQPAFFLRAPIRFALMVSLLQRLVWAALAWPGWHFQVHLERFWHIGIANRGYLHTPWQIIDMWARWDAAFYLQIAEHGYACPPNFLCTAFFPLYPMVVRSVARGLGSSMLAAGLATANIFDIAGCVLVALWLRQRLAPKASFWAFVAFAVFPTRNFGFSVYTEGLFLMLSVGSFLAYDRRRYGLSALMAAACSASRPQGVLVGLALWLDAAWNRWACRSAAVAARVSMAPKAPTLMAGAGATAAPEAPRPLWALVALSASPAGLLAYMAYLQCTFGDALQFARVQQVWHRHMQAPWRIIGVHAEPIEYVVLVGAALVCVWGIKHRAPLRDSVYVALSLLVPMSTGRFTSINRFVGVLFPLFALATMMPKRPRLALAYWLLCAVYTAVFAFKLGQGAKVI